MSMKYLSTYLCLLQLLSEVLCFDAIFPPYDLTF